MTIEPAPQITDADSFRDVADYGDVHAEYAAATAGAALQESSLRGLIQVSGRDRAAWLHNLVTQDIKTLKPGFGRYAFAINLKGRILFDVNVLALPDALWLDIDRRLVAKALAHLNRYIISEDVQLADRTEEFVRLTLHGPKAIEIADAIGGVGIEAQPQLTCLRATLTQKSRPLVRHDAVGVFGAELYVETADAAGTRARLLEIGGPVGLRPIGATALEILRIEAGIPAVLREITEEVVPAETGQLERAVNFKKGCYLGQEVVERMRSHQVLARKLVGLRLSQAVTPPAPLLAAELEVGRVTSVCESPAQGGWIGLGFVKTSHVRENTVLAAGTTPGATATVTALPFAPASNP